LSSTGSFCKSFMVLALISLFLLFFIAPVLAYTYVDDIGQTLNINRAPKRVVSLVPGATETLCAIKADKSLAGITMDDSYFECLIGVPAVGPASKPNYSLVNSLKPDLLIVPPQEYERALAARENQRYPILVWDNPQTVEEAHSRIEAMGEIFGKKKEALEALGESNDFLNTISLKTQKLPQGAQKRVMRLRAIEGGLATGSENSMDTSLIRAAGGIPPEIPGEGIVALTGEEFVRFNPQFIYACAEDRSAIEAASKKSPFSRADAIKNKAISYFPCALTNRLSAHSGYTAAWLASSIYSKEYGMAANQALPQEVLARHPLTIKNIPYIKSAEVVDYRLFDFIHRTLVIDFSSPQNVVTSGEGAWHEVIHIGNSSSPPMVWGIQHEGGWQDAEDDVFTVLGLDRANTSLIFTGADMRNLVVKSASYKDLHITALVTAGAEGNALRTSKDPGNWYDPGTINIIILSSRKLSPAGATSAMIVVTEAKTAALWDMDIRSTESPRENPATGTGTDDIIVVTGGNGSPLDYTGGHGKAGELIARVVYDGVTEALKKQNGKALNRSIWERLNERRITIEELGPAFSSSGAYPNLSTDMELLFLDPRYAGFLESALALSDAQGMGNFHDTSSFDSASLKIASEIAARDLGSIQDLVTAPGIPPLLEKALNALATGLVSRQY
jgi:adenosylcobinamide amidohydrolase/ABC-type Fe3+-hydroxamate transport system substrate-binding protein